MNFFTVDKINNLLGKSFRNKFVLNCIKWNDYYLYETLFDLYFVNGWGEPLYLGEVKIASDDTYPVFEDPNIIQRGKPTLPEDFEGLNKNFFSVGQSTEYYKNIRDNLVKFPINPLIALNDMAYDLEIYEIRKNKDVTLKSLLRSVTASTIKGQFNRIAHGGVELTPYNFSYKFRVEYASDDDCEENKMNFKVEVNSQPPTNIHVVIGRNGVGKSWLFNNMVNSYKDNSKQYGYFTEDDLLSTIFKEDCNYLFPNLIYMNYSAFDNTKNTEAFKIESDERKYVYLGLRKKVNIGSNSENEYFNKSLSELAIEFTSSLFECIASNQKKKMLLDSFEILESDPIFQQADMKSLTEYEENEDNKNKISNFFQKELSSGHGIIMLTITKLVETLEEKSLVLLDEPETHLHPPLLSAYIRCLSNLLINQNAVAIIATHSPVILQEVPKSCVWKLNRSGNITKIERPYHETFGDSYSSLIEDVFGLEIQQSGFHKIIKDEVKQLQSYDELIKKFNNQLGKDADIIARTLFMLKDMDENEDA